MIASLRHRYPWSTPLIDRTTVIGREVGVLTCPWLPCTYLAALGIVERCCVSSDCHGYIELSSPLTQPTPTHPPTRPPTGVSSSSLWICIVVQMRHLATYMLLVLGGNATPSKEDVTKALTAVGVDVSSCSLRPCFLASFAVAAHQYTEMQCLDSSLVVSGTCASPTMFE